jgi:hypothetical protein
MDFSKRNIGLQVVNWIGSGLDPLAGYCENRDGFLIFMKVGIS